MRNWLFADIGRITLTIWISGLIVLADVLFIGLSLDYVDYVVSYPTAYGGYGGGWNWSRDLLADTATAHAIRMNIAVIALIIAGTSILFVYVFGKAIRQFASLLALHHGPL